MCDEFFWNFFFPQKVPLTMLLLGLFFNSKIGEFSPQFFKIKITGCNRFSKLKSVLANKINTNSRAIEQQVVIWVHYPPPLHSLPSLKLSLQRLCFKYLWSTWNKKGGGGGVGFCMLWNNRILKNILLKLRTFKIYSRYVLIIHFLEPYLFWSEL